MAGESILKMGGVFLNYSVFSWPRYRGLQPRMVEIVQPSERFKELKQLAESLQGQPTTITVGGPKEAGASPADDEVKIERVYIHRVINHEMTCRVQCYDARFRLLRFVNDRDFNLRFGEGYLQGTEKQTYQSAIRHILDTSSAVRALFTGMDRIPAAVVLPDNLQLNGLSMIEALGLLCEEGGFDIVNRVDGLLTFSNRLDAANDYLPGKEDYDWHTEPGWVQGDMVTLGRPREFHVYSRERHCLELTNKQGQSTGGVAKELEVELEQVYADNGEIYTLDELLEANGYAIGDLTEDQIADSILTDTLQGSIISDDAALNVAGALRIIAAVKDGWRRLWRIRYVNDAGKWGAWTDFDFGKINEDGSTLDVGVDCPWVEILTVLHVGDDSSTTSGHDLTINHESPAPFRPTWEMDAAAGVIRLVQDVGQLADRQNLALPGALIDTLRTEPKTVVTDGENENEQPNNYRIIGADDPSLAKFVKNFTLKIYVCATKRLPNDETRWHKEVATGYDDGDIPWVELPPGELFCVRDYTASGDPAHFAQADGLGPVLNADALKNSADARAKNWQVVYGMRAGGEGVAERLQMFRDHDLNGPIKEISLDLTLEGENAEVQVMRSRMLVGDLSDPAALDKRKRKREAQRPYKEAGVAVA